jgi:predicted nucleic acid-binding protein
LTNEGSKVIVLDTWAMLTYLDGELAAQDVRQVLSRARRKDVLVLFSLINYGECLYLIERARGLQNTQLAVSIIDQLAVRVVPTDRSLVFEAAHLKACHPISNADAFSVALGKRNRAHLMTGDPEFQAVEADVAIHWLPDRRG